MKSGKIRVAMAVVCWLWVLAVIALDIEPKGNRQPALPADKLFLSLAVPWWFGCWLVLSLRTAAHKIPWDTQYDPYGCYSVIAFYGCFVLWGIGIYGLWLCYEWQRLGLYDGVGHLYYINNWGIPRTDAGVREYASAFGFANRLIDYWCTILIFGMGYHLFIRRSLR
jgi:hypothetical protein